MKKLIYSKEDLDLILALELEEKEEEIERLTNIINELEDLIVIKLQRDYHEHNYRISTGDLEEIYDKLQGLKGDSSNE